MAEAERFDAIIIGSGQAGSPLSRALGEAGWKVALVEREHIGGTCINEGCTPTKTMVASARVAYLARRAADYGVQTGPIMVDMQKVRQRKRDIVDSFRGGGERRIQNVSNIDLLMGEARFIGPKTVEVTLNGGGTRQLDADKILINAGARPSKPDLKGIENVPTLDSTSIMELDVAPEHLIVIGGGYIGLEFGQMFRRFGSQVTVVQRGDQLLGNEDADIAEEVTTIMRDDGIEVLLKTDPQRVEKMPDGKIHLTVSAGGSARTLVGSHLLVAAGRTPNTERLNLPAAGVEVDKRGFIKANSVLETNVAGIYALGDIKGGPAFTHISYDDFRIARDNLLNGKQHTIDNRPVPYTVFIDPQLGRVGLTEKQAREAGHNIKVTKMPMNYVARALEVDEARGVMKAIVDADSGQILGCAILGLEGGEIMAMLQIAMMGKLPYTALRDAIFSHPTLAEALNNLFASLE